MFAVLVVMFVMSFADPAVAFPWWTWVIVGLLLLLRLLLSGIGDSK